MQLSPEQQQAMDEQKAQCPFCKIVKGEIQSKKVYEDELLLGILDINPASTGHILLMPKEHYPIMPLIPQETFDHLFSKTKLLSAASKQGMLTFSNTIYIANGYAAGQQSSHFMLHIIPRQEMDGLDFFSLKKGIINQKKLDEAFTLLKHNLPIMLRDRYARYPLEGAPAQAQQQRQYTKESLIKLIESNQQLKDMIQHYPDDFKKQVQENVRLKQLFADINIKDIIDYFATDKTKKQHGEQKDGETITEEEQSYSMNELVDIVNDNPKLKEILLKQTYAFAEKIQQIPELKKIFGNVDIEELERAVLRKDIHEEQDVNDLLENYAKQLRFNNSVPDADSNTNYNEDELDNYIPHDEDEPKVTTPKQDQKVQQRTEEEHSVQQKEEKNEDLISKLHKEMLRRKV